MTTINNHLKRLTPKQKRLVDQVLANESIADAGLAAVVRINAATNKYKEFAHHAMDLDKAMRGEHE